MIRLGVDGHGISGAIARESTYVERVIPGLLPIEIELKSLDFRAVSEEPKNHEKAGKRIENSEAILHTHITYEARRNP